MTHVRFLARGDMLILIITAIWRTKRYGRNSKGYGFACGLVVAGAVGIIPGTYLQLLKFVPGCSCPALS